MNFYISSLMKESMWDFQCSVAARSWLLALIRDISNSTALLCVPLLARGPSCCMLTCHCWHLSTLELWEGLVLCHLTFVCVWSEKITACRNTATGRNRGLVQLWLFWTRNGQTVNQCRQRGTVRATGRCGERGAAFCLCFWLVPAGQSTICTDRKTSIIKRHIQIKMLQKTHPKETFKKTKKKLKDKKPCLELSCSFCSQHLHILLSRPEPKRLDGWGKRIGLTTSQGYSSAWPCALKFTGNPCNSSAAAPLCQNRQE